MTIRLSDNPTTTATALAVPVCTLASGWYRSFYKTEKSITGRRAHNPIHPGGCTAGVLLCFVEKPTDLAG
ncbi:hypothetical protein ACUY8D_005271, partial [Escherichia coli]